MTTCIAVLVSASIGACVGALLMALVAGGSAWRGRSRARENEDTPAEED